MDLGRYRTVLVLMSIIALAIFIRALFLVRGQFIDPETMAAVLTMRQTVTNNFTIPQDRLAWFPDHPYEFPEHGIVYLVTIPYAVLPFLGFFGIMYLIKILFVLLAVLAVYMFAKKITGQMEAGVLGALLYAVSQVGTYTEAFNRWKGDSFVPTLLLLSVLLFVYMLESNEKHRKRRYRYGIGILLLLLASALLWNGGLYAVAAFIFTALAVALTYFVKRLDRLLPIMLAIIALSCILLLAKPVGALINLGNVTTSTSQIVQVAGQIEPLAYQTSLLYNNTMLYPIWILVGFIISFGLALITIYCFRYGKRNNDEKKAYVAALALLLFGMPFAILSSRFSSLIYLPLAVLGGSSIALLGKERRVLLLALLLVIIPSTLAFTFYQILTTPLYSGMTPQFHSELEWLADNTSANATFLAFDGDSTAIQYWANRTTYTDTNIANNKSAISEYLDFLYAREGNFTYLLSVRPDYLLIHQIPAPANGEVFNGSNIQYLIEWTYNPHPVFSYDGISFQLVYANFTLSDINSGMILYRLSYNKT